MNLRLQSCENKEEFSTWAKAKAAIKRMRRHIGETGLTPYACGKHVHIGHVNEQFAYGKKQDDPLPHLQACKEGKRKLEELLNK
jgi:hypothetical protein